jgi:hypothetical protein
MPTETQNSLPTSVKQYQRYMTQPHFTDGKREVCRSSGLVQGHPSIPFTSCAPGAQPVGCSLSPLHLTHTIPSDLLLSIWELPISDHLC